jgi:hypothetical protein
VGWLLATLWITFLPAPPRDDKPEWKLKELHNPFPEARREKPLPPDDELKLHELKPPP